MAGNTHGGALGDHEVEAKLVLVGPDRRETLDDLAARENLLGEILGPVAESTMHDAYLDTADRALAERGAALRLRVVGEAAWLAFKADERPEGLAVRRVEVEGPWSIETRERIATRLGDLAFLLDELAGARDVRALRRAAAGRTVQERRIRRRRRALGRWGELDLDEVRFAVGPLTVVHHEVEVEAHGQEGGARLPRFARDLLAELGERALAWRHSKLATGEAIAELARAGRLRSTRGDAPVELEPTARDYRRLDEMLRGR